MPARPLLTSIAVVLALVLDLVAGPTATGLPSPQITPRAIGTTRKAATVAALARFPFFFHTQPVRVRGKATEKDGLFQLEHEAARVWLVAGGTGKLPDPGTESEITGVYVDVGRLERTDVRVVSRDFLALLGVKVVAGRGFDGGDRDGQARVMLINETLARSGEFDGDPIGKRFYTLGEEPWEIVGIVEDIQQFGPDRDPGRQVFIDFRQAPTSSRNGLFIAVRSDRDPTALVSHARSVARSLDPLATLDNVATMEQLLSNASSRPRFYAVWLAVFAIMAVLLAVVGLYGLMSYAVAQRTPEIGIRVALGAQRHEVMELVLKDSVATIAIGITLGLAGASALTRYLEGMLFALTPLDPVTFAVVAVLFAAVALLASYVPARRAIRVDPLVALRAE